MTARHAGLTPARPTPVGPDEIDAAAERLGDRVRRTPVLGLASGNLGLSSPLTLKLELLQHSGSFKARGAFNRVLAVERPPALVAASGGNHGAAVAYVGRALGLPVEVFVPAVTSRLKRERITGFGAQLVVGGDIYDDAQRAADARAGETGALLVHPYDHGLVVAGQGTVGRELDDQVPELDTVLVAVGGGGLIAGVASWYRGRAKVVSVEPEVIPAMERALAAGAPVEVGVSGVAADSLGAKRIGAVPWACASPFVHEAVLVPDDAITATQRLLWSELRLVAEPGGAAALAALVCGAYRPSEGERVAVIVCGSNTDPSALAALSG
jgi:threonine dehydratase